MAEITAEVVAQHGLSEEEYARVLHALGREPNLVELGIFSVMWSEHCSYKSSKIYLRRFGQKVSDEMKERLMVGMGQNAINQYLQGQRFRTGIEEGRATGATNLASQNLQNAINWGYDTGSQLNAQLSRQWQAPLDLMKENALVQMGITSQTPLAQFPLAGLGYGVAQGLQDLGGLRGAYRQAAAANPGTNLWDVASIVSLALSPNPSGLVTAAALQGGKYLTR